MTESSTNRNKLRIDRLSKRHERLPECGVTSFPSAELCNACILTLNIFSCRLEVEERNRLVLGSYRKVK